MAAEWRRKVERTLEVAQHQPCEQGFDEEPRLSMPEKSGILLVLLTKLPKAHAACVWISA